MTNPTSEIYIVTHGSYSDYGILGVFLDRALADEFAAQRRADVEVWPLGALDLPVGHRRYRVIMDEEGSTEEHGVDVISTCGEDVDLSHAEGDTTGPHTKWGTPERFLYTGTRAIYVTTDMGEQGAIKIANERRLRLVADNQWPKKGQVRG